jgi:Dienelactone hydrolase family
MLRLRVSRDDDRRPIVIRRFGARGNVAILEIMSGIGGGTTTCGGEMPAFVAAPADDSPAPAVIVRHERYGFVRHGRELAERFARDGSVAIAPRAQAEAAWAGQRAFLDEMPAPGYDRLRRAQRDEADIAVDYDVSRNVRRE